MMDREGCDRRAGRKDAKGQNVRPNGHTSVVLARMEVILSMSITCGAVKVSGETCNALICPDAALHNILSWAQPGFLYFF